MGARQRKSGDRAVPEEWSVCLRRDLVRKNIRYLRYVRKGLVGIFPVATTVPPRDLAALAMVGALPGRSCAREAKEKRNVGKVGLNPHVYFRFSETIYMACEARCLWLETNGILPFAPPRVIKQAFRDK